MHRANSELVGSYGSSGALGVSTTPAKHSVGARQDGPISRYLETNSGIWTPHSKKYYYGADFQTLAGSSALDDAIQSLVLLFVARSRMRGYIGGDHPALAKLGKI